MSSAKPTLLPLECPTRYYPDFLAPHDSAELFEWIRMESGVPDAREITLADGSTFVQETGKLMFVDPVLTDHDVFSAAHGRRIAWPPVVVPLRDRIEKLTGMEFSVCVCIYYPDGKASAGFHFDPPAFGPTTVIPSISLGAKRKFQIRRQEDHSDEYGIELADGSLLIMGEGFQNLYEHSVPVAEECWTPRINLTFRPFEWPTGFQRDSRL